MKNNPLNLISPIDGRYEKYTRELTDYFSEAAIMKYKILAEGEYLLALADTGVIRKLTSKEREIISSLPEHADTELISQIELGGYKKIPATNHDFKAIEYYLKEKMNANS